MTQPILKFKGRHRFLSNFWISQIKYNQMLFPSVEHAYQAQKPTDAYTRHAIGEASTPGAAKFMGNAITNIRPDWEHVKLEIMETLLRIKFKPGSFNAAWLNETDDADISEGNHHGDQFWGKTYNLANQRWEGENHLGKLLMKIREDNRK